MNLIEKILATLKEGEFTFGLIVLINALQFYLICFYFIDEFKNILWYQEILISASISLSYTFSFFVCMLCFFGLFLSWTPIGKEQIFNIIESKLILYFSIFPLSYSIIYQMILVIYFDGSANSLMELSCNVIWICVSLFLTPLMILLRNRKSKVSKK